MILKHVPPAAAATLEVALASLLLYGASATPTAAEGHLHLVWGDSPPGADPISRQVLLFTEDGPHARQVVLEDGGPRPKADPQILLSKDMERILMDTEPGRALVTGDQTWAILMCRFADVAVEPRALGFFEDLISDHPGRLGSFWEEASYGAMGLGGSFVVDWLPLAGRQIDYVATPGSGCASGMSVQLTKLLRDCAEAADPVVDFSQVDGIHVMLNGELDGCAWGGFAFATLDGVTRNWPATWAGPTGYAHEGLIAHETGHALGLPHSNNSDLDTNTYDSPWDVMSSPTGGGAYDVDYGRLPVHPIATQKERLGWLAPATVLEISGNGTYLLALDHLAAETMALHLVKIPLDDAGRHITVEVRGPLPGSFDAALPGSEPVVLIHEIDPTRLEPAWLVDGDAPPATYSNTEGVMWRAGEVFESPVDVFDHTVRVHVVRAVGSGFEVEIDFERNLCPGFDDGLDADGDGVPDGCDTCSHFDDRLDADGDGVADGCDACFGENSSGDDDVDGVCGDLDCDDTAAGVSAEDLCGVCGGDGSSCALIFSDGFESGDRSRW